MKCSIFKKVRVTLSNIILVSAFLALGQGCPYKREPKKEENLSVPHRRIGTPLSSAHTYKVEGGGRIL